MAEKRRKVWLSDSQVDRMLGLTEKASERDHLLLVLMRYGLRCGEIVGRGRLRGIHTEDLRPTGIWVKGKRSKEDHLIPLPVWLLERLRAFAPRKGKLFDISEYWAETLVKRYAKEAGIEDWEHVGPHRLRAFFATDAKEKGLDAFTVRDLMRHKSVATTNLYVGKTSPERLRKIVESL